MSDSLLATVCWPCTSTPATRMTRGYSTQEKLAEPKNTTPRRPGEQATVGLTSFTGRAPAVPSSPSWPYLAQKNQSTPILRSHSCTAFPVEFLPPKKMIRIFILLTYVSRFVTCFQKVKKVNPNPVTAMQRFECFQK